jgi:NAD(P)-dependent dehydrogenase (short-subunit alcohol dehydrogenase family)
MGDRQQQPRSALVFGARNLGKAVIELLIGAGWSVTGVARSAETLQGVTDAGALALRADITDQASVRDAVAQTVAAQGGIDLIVNAASAYGGKRTGPFGGGPMAEADAEAFDSWATAPARAAFAFLSGTAGYLVGERRQATLIQVTGGSARRAMPGRGLWAAGAFGVRAITQAAAQELRPQGIHVALLIVDAGIQPLSGASRPGVEPQALADPHELAGAVLYLAEQGSRAATHELQVTPLAETWVP